MIPRSLRRRARADDRLDCAVCLYSHGKATATTVLEGYAVCADHLGVVAQGSTFHSIVRMARGDYR